MKSRLLEEIRLLELSFLTAEKHVSVISKYGWAKTENMQSVRPDFDEMRRSIVKRFEESKSKKRKTSPVIEKCIKKKCKGIIKRNTRKRKRDRKTHSSVKDSNTIDSKSKDSTAFSTTFSNSRAPSVTRALETMHNLPLSDETVIPKMHAELTSIHERASRLENGIPDNGVCHAIRVKRRMMRPYVDLSHLEEVTSISEYAMYQLMTPGNFISGDIIDLAGSLFVRRGLYISPHFLCRHSSFLGTGNHSDTGEWCEHDYDY